MTNLTPVEALQRAIDKQAKWLAHLESMRPVHNSEQIRDQRQMLAALELAKAYAILREWNFDPSLDLTSAEIDAKDFALHKAESDAFTKLYEALRS